MCCSFDLRNAYWLNGIKNEFKTAIDCSDLKPHCSYYDIDGYTVRDNVLSISLTSDCYPHVIMRYASVFEIAVALDSVKNLFNDLGKHILI